MAVGIVGVLVGLTVPAVQQARAAAARVQCQSNLRQVGIALHVYHDAKQAFPFASGRPRPGVVSHKEHTHAHAEGEIDGSIRPQSWAISILPFIEEGALAALYDRYCLACPPESQESEIVDARLRIYNSRSGVAGGLDFAALLGPGPVDPDPARRLDLWYYPSAPQAGEFTGMLVPEGLGWDEESSVYVRGIAAKPVRMTHVTDGLSKTLALAESGDYTTDGGLTWRSSRYSWPYVSDVGRYVGRGVGAGAVPLETSLKPLSRLGGGVCQALAGDGSVRSLEESLAPSILISLTSRSGGDSVGP